jgi:hypothetical protein
VKIRVTAVALLICFCSLISVSNCYAESSDTTNATSQQVKKEKVEKVSSWFVIMGQDPIAKIHEVTNSMAMQYTLQLGGGAKDWTPSNSNWQRVYDQVNADVQVEVKRFVDQHRNEFKSIWEEGFANALSVEDVDALTEYAKSEKGKRYWQLSTEVANLFTDTVTRSSTGNPKISNSPLTQEEIKSWGNVLKATNGVQVTQALIESERLAGRDTSGLAGVWIMWSMVLSVHQDDFRRLAATYKDDLTTFEAFNESPLGKRQAEAIVTSGKQMSPQFNGALLDFANQINKYQVSWKRLYESARSA